MSALSPFRLLTPAGWSLLAVGLLVLLLALGHGLGFRWDPFGSQARRLDQAEARAEIATAEAAARRLESSARAEQTRRLDTLHQQAVAVERATVRATAQARNASDASTPLDPARADRLADHDRELCRLAPALCRAAPTDPAAGGDPAVRPGSSA